jgi:hypothetical protein
MTYDSSTFNINPYYDDFDASRGFLRVLFKPGYALQARELTQLQTVLQDQISKIGDHIFKDGSRIVGGSINIRTASYVSVDVGTGTALSGVSDYSPLVGGFLQAGNNNKAKIVHYIDPDYSADGKLILIVDFISGTDLGTDFVWSKQGIATTYTLTSSPVTAFVTTGNCKLVTVSEGIFYVDGFFVRNSLQNFTPFRVVNNVREFSFNGFSQLSKKIGFSLVRDSVTDEEDSTLRDPAIGSYNYNAPGADRYKINLVMSQLDYSATSTDFVELLRFENGRITKRVERVSYGEIERVFARRTYDESGSYTVKPFEVTIKPKNATAFDAYIGSGKAYLYGYELENQYPQVVGISRAQETQSEGNRKYPFSVGNWLGVSMGPPRSTTGSTFGYGETFSDKIITVSQGSAVVRFRRGPLNNPGAIVATGYIHGYDPELQPGITSTNARLYLYGISGSVSGASIGYIYEHGAGSAVIGNTIGQFAPLSGNEFSALSDTDNQNLVYEITPGYAIKDFSYLKIWTKLASNDINPANDALTPQTTTYTVNNNSFSNTIGSSDSSIIKFDDYGTSNSSVDANKLSAIRIVNKGVNKGGIGYAPTTSVATPNGISLYNSTTTPGSGFILAIKPAVAGFTSGPVNVICPVIYTPNLSSSPSSQYRTKTATSTTHNFTSSAFVTEGLRKYFLLPNTDVFSITRVYYTSGTQQINITSDFELDDGQRESFYDYSRLYIKPTAANEARYTVGSGGQNLSIIVEYIYFAHGGLAYAPFVGSMSYINHPYEQIPLYTNTRTGKTVSLANCLDFRRSTPTSTTPMIKPYGRMEFGVNEDTIVSYTHYLPRVDKLCVKKNTEDGSPIFFIVRGKPDMSPIAPPDPVEGLVINTLTVPAYTHNTSDITITTNDTKRYTMADIGKIQQRVDEVEVFAKLSLAESEIESRSIRSTPASTEPIKTSIYSDQLYGHSVSDVASSEHICSIDFERGELRPFFKSSNISLRSVSPALTHVVMSTDGVATLSYSEEEHLSNKQYTKTIAANPSNNVNWLGFMKLSTQIIPLYDSGYRPVVRTNSLMENDNWLSSNAANLIGFGTQWNDWESFWTGIEDIQEEQDGIQSRLLALPRVNSLSSVPLVNSGNVRVASTRNTKPIDQKNSLYIRARNLKNRITNRIGSKIVDRSVVPFIPTTTITATVTGLKPNTTGLILYFDGDPLQGGVVTDQNGSCTVSFTIPSNTYTAGEKTVRISDNANIENSTMSADAVLFCSGLIQQRDSGSYSTRPPELRRQSASSETIAKDPFNRDVDALENTHSSDPLSQTFFVDKKTNPEGVFLSSVSLFFSAKDQTLPVTVQIRPTVSGYPSPSVVLPFSTVTKIPDQVNINSSYPQEETVFQFSTPVYLEPGEYSICVLTNSSDYLLYAADSSLNSVANGESVSGRAGNNQLVGSLYAPQGIGTAVQDNTTDLMFSVSRCKFTSVQGTLSFHTVSSVLQSHLFKIQSPEILPSGCTITRSLANINFENGETVYPVGAISPSPTIEYFMSRGANTAVSPVVDFQAQYGQAFTLFANSTNPVSEYVSRVIELPETLGSNGIVVFLDGNVPAEAGISVSYRYVGIGEAELFGKPWVTLTQNTVPFTSVSELDFRELRYSSQVLSYPEKFKGYQVKISLTAPSTGLTYFKTPAVKNIRVVSFVV